MDSTSKVNKSCGSRLKEARKAKKITQQQLADKVNVDAKYISALENNRRSMSLELAKDISNIVGIRVEYLMCEDDCPTYKELFSTFSYSFEEQALFREIFTGNGYKLNTPFGRDGDSALFTFLSSFITSHILTKENENYLCTDKQLHCFLKNSRELLELMKKVLLKQFFETSCKKISSREADLEHKKMMEIFIEKFGDEGKLWLKEQEEDPSLDTFIFSTGLSGMLEKCENMIELEEKQNG